MEVPQAPDAQLEIPPLPNNVYPFAISSMKSMHPVLRENAKILNNAFPRVDRPIAQGDPLDPLALKEERKILLTLRGAQSEPFLSYTSVFTGLMV